MLKEYQIEQPICYKMLTNTIVQNSLAHAYLFISFQYSKTFDLVFSFAKEILTKEIKDNKMKEQIIYQINKGIYDDLIIIDTESSWIKKEDVLQLQQSFSTKSFTNNKRVYIIKDAHKLNKHAANSLLKFLEEPSEDIYALLITDNKNQLLDTITSRCLNITLKRNVIKENDLTLKLTEILFNKKEEKQQFLKLIEDDNLIAYIINFLLFLEINKEETIIYTNKLWHDKIIKRELYKIAFDIMILFYKDILNCLFEKEIDLFNSYKEDIIELSKKNNISQITNKINTIIKCKEELNYNVNLKLLIDKLIIKIGG